MRNEFVDLVTHRGEIIRIECPVKFYDELYESLANAMKRGDQWCANQFDGCKVEYLGVQLTRVNMKNVIGVM